MKRMTDEEAQMLRSNIWVDDGITAFDQLMAEFSRARAREARLEAALRDIAAQVHNGHMMGPGNMSDLAIKALEAE